MIERHDTLLEVDDLKVHFARAKAGWFQPPEVVRAVDGVSFSIPRGTTLAIVGESGSGKTTTALAVMRLAPITAGAIRLGDTDLGALEGEALRQARRRLQIIFQDPFSSLNPRQRAGDAVRAPLDLMQSGRRRERARARRPSCSPRSACGRSSSACFRTSSRAVSDSASTSRARSPPTPSWSSATSRCRRSTSRSAPRSSTCWCACSASSA